MPGVECIGHLVITSTATSQVVGDQVDTVMSSNQTVWGHGFYKKKTKKNMTLQGIYVWSEKTFEEYNPILFHLQPPYSQVSDFLYYQRLLLSIIIVNHLLSGSDTI